MTARACVHHLSEILSQRKHADAKNARRSLFEACRTIGEALGDDIAGYAVVAWSRDGELRSAYDPGHGPIKAPLIPTLAGDALNRHVALDMAPPVHKE